MTQSTDPSAPDYAAPDTDNGDPADNADPGEPTGAGPMSDPDFGGKVAGLGGFADPHVLDEVSTDGPQRQRAIVADNPGLGAAVTETVPDEHRDKLATAGDNVSQRVTAQSQRD